MKGKRKILLVFIFALMVLALGGIVYYYWYNNTYYITTEDATVSGDLVRIYPQISGRLLEFNIKEGDKVFKNQILGHQEMINGLDTNIEQSVIRAPVDGVIIKKTAQVGEIISAGTTLAILVDPEKLYINANIEETKLGRVRTGQSADITIDAFEGKKYLGKVDFVGLASNSTFGLLPSSSGATFTKVVQRIPLRIEFDQHDPSLLPGTNAVIKIHIK